MPRSRRLTDALKDMGKYDDTLFIYIAGDNGASAEGGLDGTFNELMALNGIPQVLEDILPTAGRDRRTEVVQPLSGRLGPCDEHAVPVHQAGGVALRRYPQRGGDELAQRHRGSRRGAPAVASRDRHRAHDPRGGRAARSRTW